jgi:hypothetical protein
MKHRGAKRAFSSLLTTISSFTEVIHLNIFDWIKFEVSRKRKKTSIPSKLRNGHAFQERDLEVTFSNLRRISVR